MATFIGSTLGGILGSFVATLGVVLPSFLIILLIASALKNLMKYAPVNAFLSGVRPCVVAMIRRISFRCGGLSIERNQKPLAPKITLAATHHDRQKQVEVKRSSRVNPHEIRLLSGCPYAVVK